MKGIKGEKMLNVTTKDKSVVVQWPVWGGHGIDLGVAHQGLWGFLSFFFSSLGVARMLGVVRTPP